MSAFGVSSSPTGNRSSDATAIYRQSGYQNESSIANNEAGGRVNIAASPLSMSMHAASTATATPHTHPSGTGRKRNASPTNPATRERSSLNNETEMVPPRNTRARNLPNRATDHEIRAIAQMMLSNTSVAQRLPSQVDASQANAPQSIPSLPRAPLLQHIANPSIHPSSIRRLGFSQCTISTQSVANLSPAPPPFNIFDILLQQTDIMLIVAKWVDPDTLCTLYTVSRKFHYMVNGSHFAFIKANQKVWAPWGDTIFPHHYFRQCCIEDPMTMRLNRDPNRIRLIPGFKWLKMVYHRQKMVDEILYQLDRAGHRLPRDTHLTLQKMWMVMSFPGNGTRIGLIHNRQYWRNKDLFMATIFMLKLDMYFTDPIHGNGETTLREMFLAKNSFKPLHILLHKGYTPLHLFEQFVAYNLRVPAEFAGMSVLGIPSHLIGRGSTEGWGAGEERQMRIDELIMMESIKRGLRMNCWYIDMIAYGYQPESDNTPLLPDEAEPRIHAKTLDERVNWHLQCYQAHGSEIIDLYN